MEERKWAIVKIMQKETRLSINYYRIGGEEQKQFVGGSKKDDNKLIHITLH